MILKFIFVLCLFFSVCESSSVFKPEHISLITKKNPPLIDVTSKSNQSDKDSLRSSKTVENVQDCSLGSLNCTEAHFISNNIDLEKENKKIQLHEHPTIIEVISAVDKNISLHRPPTNQTIMDEYHRLNSINKSVVVEQTRDKDNDKDNGSKTRYTKLTEAGATKVYAVQRMVRAQTESVQSILKKIFPDDFFSKQHDSDSIGSRDAKHRNRNSSRRQKMKKLGAGSLDGEAVYFRAENENTSAAGGSETPPLSGAETHTSAAAETSAPSAAETSAPSAAETSAPGAAETSAPAAAETSAPAAAETSAPAAAETSAPATAETSASVAAETPAPGPLQAHTYVAAETPAPGAAETHPTAVTETSSTLTTAQVVPLEYTAGSQAELPATSVPSEGSALTSGKQQPNYHYHFHYFGGVQLPTLPAEAHASA